MHVRACVCVCVCVCVSEIDTWIVVVNAAVVQHQLDALQVVQHTLVVLTPMTQVAHQPNEVSLDTEQWVQWLCS